MEGIPIGRKLNVLAHGSYHELVKRLENMFETTILWGTEMDEVVVQPGERCHVFTYEDDRGDLVMIGDIPWEMFVSPVKRLKITRVDTFSSFRDTTEVSNFVLSTTTTSVVLITSVESSKLCTKMRNQCKEPVEEKDTEYRDADPALDLEISMQPEPPHPLAEGGGT
ncbi:auxin-responsive protein IAA22-like [Arachis stenosperma]|uniref:auxin-responsive protein IAA22-like n=1 Tax=Arachis stenosperma TaxID=217475 RepID=UPI0025AC2B9E|nr:auxin-responsive protein IAA22-like [Arachis stenosperma]